MNKKDSREIVIEDVQEKELLQDEELVEDTGEEGSEEQLDESPSDSHKGQGPKKDVETIDESKTEKAYDKSWFGMGDSRSEQEIRDQIKNLDDKTLKIWAKDTKKSFLNSKVRKLQNQLVAQELKRRGLQTESTLDDTDGGLMHDDEEMDYKPAKATLNKDKKKSKAGKLKEMAEKLSELDGEEFAAAYDAIMSESLKSTKVNFEEDLDALVQAEESLSEGFRSKAATIFEAAVKSKVADKVVELEESYQQQLDESMEQYREELVEKVDEYMSYAVQEYIEENRLAIESGIRAEMAESFMQSLKTVFVEHYVDVPESKIDLVDELGAKVEELEEELETSTKEFFSLQEQVAELQRERCIAEAAEGLTSTEAEKLKSLVEDIDFDSVESFEKKVTTIKESYFSTKKVTSTQDELDTPTLSEDEVTTSPLMDSYISALSKK